MTDNMSLIRDFVYAKVDEREIADHEDVFETGYVSSMFAVQALTWAEKTFGLTIRAEDLMVDNFRSIRAIADFVARKQTPAPVPE